MESSKGDPSRRRSALLASGRRQIVDLLAGLPEHDPGLSAAELAVRLGVHVSTVRFHLDRLRDAGVVTGDLTHDHAVGRPGMRYTLSDRTAANHHDGEHLRMLAQLLAESFRATSRERSYAPEELGERWAVLHARDVVGIGTEDQAPARTPGQWFAKVGRIVDLLLAWGYAPELSTRDNGERFDLRLRECPFLELAKADPDLICGIHRGLLRGALREFGEPASRVVLEEFTDPPLCRVQISRTATEKEHA